MKIHILGVVIIAIIIVAAVMLRFDQSSPQESLTTRGENAKFIVAVLALDVFVKNLGDSDFTKLKKEGEAGEGSEIQTSGSGQASILYPDGTVVSVKESSELLLATLADNGKKSSIKLFIGGLRSKVENILGVGDFYQIETENMVASVRGTDFGVDFEQGISVAEVFEGEVEVEAVDPITGKIIEGTLIKLLVGDKVIVDSRSLPYPGTPLRKTKTVEPTIRPTPRPTLLPTLGSTHSTDDVLGGESTASASLPQATPTPEPSINSVTPQQTKRSFYNDAEFTPKTITQ